MYNVCIFLTCCFVWCEFLIFNNYLNTLYHPWFFLQKSWMVQKGSSNLSVSIIKIRKWCHWPRVLDTSLWGWNFLFFIIFYLSSFACLTGHCSCDLVLYVILNLWLCESNLLVWPSKTLHYPCVGGSWCFLLYH